MRRLLAGLAARKDATALTTDVADLHPAGNTFPGEVFLRLAAEVLELHRAAGAGPVTFEEIRERHLAEISLSGRDNNKFKTTVLSAGAMAGGLEPDLLDEIYWWGQHDDFWRFGLFAAVAITRASASERGLAVEDLVTELATRHELSLAED